MSVDPLEIEREPARVLLVDDNPTNLHVLYQSLAGEGYKLLMARSGPEALRIAKETQPQVVLLDVQMPEMDGFETCQRLLGSALGAGTNEALSVIFISALGDSESKVRGLSVGAVDFVSKPFDAEEVKARVRTQVRLQEMERELRVRNERLGQELSLVRALLDEGHARYPQAILGQSAGSRMLREMAIQAARAENDVLLLGPIGCEPEAIARQIHRLSSRVDGPFLTLTRDRLSGADPDSLGAQLRLARRGSYYIEMVDALPDRWLRALTREATKETTGITARLILHSARNLGAEVLDGGFPSELFARVARQTVTLPTLASRIDDLDELAQRELARIRSRIGGVGELSPSSLERLRRHHWPGNLRELRIVLERAVQLSHGPIVEVDPELLSAQGVVGGYRLTRRIGSGGMGDVWEARHHLLARPAAVKLIRKEGGEPLDELVVRRFRREARTTANLRSPHTVELYDFGVDHEGDLYYVMELLDGIDLQRMVEQHGPLPQSRVVHILKQVALSLAEAHECGLIHRDIKPANLYACRLGLQVDVMKVLDFGLVKATREHTDESYAPGDGGLLGTPRYMAPEGIAGVELDARADIHSLGCVAYFLLTGEHAYDAPTLPSLVYLKTSEPPRRLERDDVEPALVELIHECMAREVEQRLVSARELFRRLDALDEVAPWTARDAAVWWQAHLPSGDHPPVEAERVGVGPLDETRQQPRGHVSELGAGSLVAPPSVPSPASPPAPPASPAPASVSSPPSMPSLPSLPELPSEPSDPGRDLTVDVPGPDAPEPDAARHDMAGPDAPAMPDQDEGIRDDVGRDIGDADAPRPDDPTRSA